MTDRIQMIRKAAELPKGDATRRKILAELRKHGGEPAMSFKPVKVGGLSILVQSVSRKSGSGPTGVFDAIVEVGARGHSSRSRGPKVADKKKGTVTVTLAGMKQSWASSDFASDSIFALALNRWMDMDIGLPLTLRWYTGEKVRGPHGYLPDWVENLPGESPERR